MNERSNSEPINGANNLGSGNLCYLYVRPTHMRDGRRNKQALERRDISPSSVARFHTKYKIVVGGCWEWTASRFHYGHGQFVLQRDEYGNQRHEYAHRVAYVLAKGDIPQGGVVRHACDNPPCCNPDHLLLGDQGDNVRDAARQGRYSGSRPSIQKITDEQVREIRASGELGVELARRYGVSESCISGIRRGLRRTAA